MGLWVGHYRNQGYDRKMVTSSNNPVDAEAKGEWAQTARGATALVAPSVKAPIRTVDLRGSAVPGSPTAQRLRVWQVYWVDGHWTVSDTEARLRMAVSRLLGRGEEAAVVFMYTPVPATAAAPNVMDAALADFATEALPLIDARLRRVDAGSTPSMPRN